jgi:hypothetical protein
VITTGPGLVAGDSSQTTATPEINASRKSLERHACFIVIKAIPPNLYSRIFIANIEDK